MKKVLISALSWSIAFNLLILFRYFGQDLWSDNIVIAILGATVSGSIVGIVYSITDGIFEKTHLKRKSFIYIFFIKSAIYIIAIIPAIWATVFVIEILDGDFSYAQLGISLTEVFSSSITLLYAVYTILLSVIFFYYKQIYKKLGPGTLVEIFLGKYHKPKEEERIFMFLDMASSTTIAEKLDSFAFSSFLQDFFFDLDRLIKKTKGMTFQFVGDEVVIVWKLKDGIANNNCINFFFLAEKKMKRERQKYLKKYGVVPEFKAGMHFGKIIITKVGESKEEIAYHGDTINTAARIRSECNNTDKKILISAELLSILTNLDDGYTIESQGVYSLKGKKNVVGLVAVEEKA